MALQIVDDRQVAVALFVRNFIDADFLYSPDFMAFSVTLDDAMEDVRHGGGGNATEFCGLFLGHDFAQLHDVEFEAVGALALWMGPGNVLLPTSMGWTSDLSGRVVHSDAQAANGNVTPGAGSAWRFSPLDQGASATALGTSGAALVGLDEKMEDTSAQP